MAGDWIPIQYATSRKPEIGVIARALKCSRAEAFFAAFRAWCWADEQGTIVKGNCVDGDCHVSAVTRDDLDYNTNAPGLADALRSAGWLIVTEDGLTFPRGGRHMGETAKERLRNSKNQKNSRKKKPRARKSNRVTGTSPHSGDKTVTTEQNRTEQINTPPLPPSLDNERFREAWRDWIDHLIQKRKKPSLKAVELQVKKCAASDDPVGLIEHSIANNWQGLFPPDKKPGSKAKAGAGSEDYSHLGKEYD